MRLACAMFFALLALGALSAPADAQQGQALIVSSCGSQSLTAATYGYLTMDTTGKLCDGSGGGSGGSVTQGTTPWVDSITQWGGGTLGAMANYGTSPGAVLVPGVNASITNVPAVSQSGTWNIGTITTLPAVTFASPQAVTIAGNQAVNIAQFGGVSTATGQVAVSVAPVTATNTAIVVDLRPDSPGIITLGQFTKSASVSTATASDQLGPQADTLSFPSVLSPTSSATSAMSHASTTALGTSLVAKASTGNLYGFNCAAIAGASGGNCIAYNGTTVPGTGALTGANVLDFCTFDTGTKGCSLSRIPMAVNYGTGIVILLSSAASPYTYTTGTDTGAISADYK